MRILITNDDGHLSPLLELTVEYFSKLGDVELVVPRHEQSWTGKSMTRFDAVQVERGELFGRAATFVSGTPADCVSLAVHNLTEKKPDLVVSGINAGWNMGVGFVLSSGTVGACLEANIAGLPAIAVSQAFDGATRDAYLADYMIDPARVAVFRRNTPVALDRLTKPLLSPSSCARTLACPVTWNVNLPFELSDSAVLQVAPLGKTRYGKVFHEESPSDDRGAIRVFRHRTIEKVSDPSPTCDSSLIDRGCATVTPIDLWSLTDGSCQEQIASLLKLL